jgi:hypothetical protein
MDSFRQKSVFVRKESNCWNMVAAVLLLLPYRYGRKEFLPPYSVVRVLIIYCALQHGNYRSTEGVVL